jgi:SAM-dependent methyltransferase
MNSDDVHEQWATRAGEFSPTYYAHQGPNRASERVRAALDRVVGTDASVLELGCSAGRHLAHLQDHGYTDLHGVELNAEAFEVMAERFPDLAAAGTFHETTIEALVPDLDDGAFDAVYSVQALQHVHPDETWVFDDVARVAADVLVTVENEGGHADGDVNYVDDEVPLYYRDWHAVFTDRGLVETHSEPIKRDTLRVFQPAES